MDVSGEWGRVRTDTFLSRPNTPERIVGARPCAGAQVLVDQLLKQKRTLYVSVDGPIAAGKTTLGVSMMRDVNTSGVAGRFYAESGHQDGVLDTWLKWPKELSAVFQVHMYNHCLARATAALKDCEYMRHDKRAGLVVVDRTLRGNQWFAVVNRFYTETITEREYQFYVAVRNAGRGTAVDASDLNVVLWATPTECAARMRARDRAGEVDTYQLNYFWDVKRVQLLSVLENLTAAEPFEQCVVRWGDEAAHVSRIYKHVNALLDKQSVTTSVRLMRHRDRAAFDQLDAGKRPASVLTLGDGVELLSNAGVTSVMEFLCEHNSECVAIFVADATPASYFCTTYVLHFEDM